MLTRAGAAAQQAPEELWNRLAETLVPAESDFNSDAALLLLAYAATSGDAELPLDEVAAALTAVGCRQMADDPSSAVIFIGSLRSRFCAT